MRAVLHTLPLKVHRSQSGMTPDLRGEIGYILHNMATLMRRIQIA